MRATIFVIFLSCIIAVKCDEKKPLECGISVERLRGFTLCQFLLINGTNSDTTKVNALPTMYQSQWIENKRITAIMITNSEFEQVPSAVFANFGDITRLRINDSKFKVVKKENFATAPHLKFVEFLGTNIGKIKSKAFEEAGEIEEITFENCEVTKIAKDAFEGLKNLKKLVITGSKFPDTNFLKNLPETVEITK